jgi:hypothetical protein
MLKLANQVIDAYDDVTRDILKKFAAERPETYVMSPEEHTALKDREFALSMITKTASKLNKFPINTLDNTWLSNRCFEETYHRLPAAAQSIAAFHIKKACERFKVKPSVSIEKLASPADDNVYYEEGRITASPRTAHADMSKFAAAEDIASNYTHAQYTFATTDHVKMAVAYFEEKCDEMPLETRHGYAGAIQKRAHELGMPVQQGKVIKYASDHYSAHVDAHIRSRMSLLETQPELKEQLSKLASAKTAMIPSDFAKALYSFDKEAKLARYYGGHLTDPFRATFGMIPDPYAGYRVKVGSKNLTADEIGALAHAKYSKIKEYFGPHLADEFKKEPVAIFDSLPMDSKEVMVNIANGTL